MDRCCKFDKRNLCYLVVLDDMPFLIGADHFMTTQVPLVASNRIGKEIIKTEHGDSAITFYGNSFIAGVFFIL